MAQAHASLLRLLCVCSAFRFDPGLGFMSAADTALVQPRVGSRQVRPHIAAVPAAGLVSNDDWPMLCRSMWPALPHLLPWATHSVQKLSDALGLSLRLGCPAQESTSPCACSGA